MVIFKLNFTTFFTLEDDNSIGINIHFLKIQKTVTELDRI
jgi:hypothetical protein